MKITLEELKHNNLSEEYTEGYRLVYFYSDHYTIGEYCKTIEGFMLGFCDSYPIMDDSDIPKFISTKDILNRCIKENGSLEKVAIYCTDGKVIDEMSLSIIKK